MRNYPVMTDASISTLRSRKGTAPLYDSDARPPAPIEELIAVWRFRDLLVQLVSRDIKTRYKRSVLGVGWTMINPLLTMTVLTIVFGQIFRIQTTNYPAYLLSGVLVWNFFAQSTTVAMHQLMSGGSLFHRVYVPRTIFTIAAIGTGVVNLLLALVPLAVIMVFTGAPFGPALLWLLAAIPLVAVFALGVGLLISTLSISFPDVIEIYAVLLNAWFFLTPVMYPVSIIPESYIPLVVANPMYYLVTTFRSPVHDGQAPDPAVLTMSLIVAFASLAIGWISFTARADRIAYRI
jgi:ABC-type polysaccharide/polyol phosphate export permease